MNQNEIRLFSRRDIREAVSMAEAIGAVRQAFAQLASGKALVPARTHLDITESECTGLLMPVYLPDTGKIAVKLISLCPGNPDRGLPYSHALVVVMDADTGVPLAVMEAAYLTALRTGAASGVATDLLANPTARTVAIFGAGLQGRTQLLAVCAVRPIQRAIIFDPNPEKARDYAEEMTRQLQITVQQAKQEEELREADIICTATPSDKPVFRVENVRPGVHINAIGAFKPTMQEIPPEIVKRATIVVDHLESCREEAGDLIKPVEEGLLRWEDIHAELGEIIIGKKSGRVSDREITFFKSVGNAVQDLAVADLTIRKAREKPLGMPFNLLG